MPQVEEPDKRRQPSAVALAEEEGGHVLQAPAEVLMTFQAVELMDLDNATASSLVAETNGDAKPPPAEEMPGMQFVVGSDPGDIVEVDA